MATVGTLAINIVSRHAKAIQGMKKTGMAAKQLGGTFSKIKAGIAGFSGAMVGIGSVSSVGYAAIRKLNTAFQEMDDIAKMSARIGISTEALVGLQHAADQTGAGADKLNAGLQTMAKRLGEAARGAGAAKPALEFLGLSAEKLVRMSPDKAFIEVAEAISKVSDQQQRAALTANIFSKGNMELLNTLQVGKQGLMEYQTEAEKLNLTFSREEAAKIEAYNDAMDRLGKTMTGLAREAAPGAATALTGVVEAVEPAVSRLIEMWTTLADLASKTKFASMAHPLAAIAGLVANEAAGDPLGQEREHDAKARAAEREAEAEKKRKEDADKALAEQKKQTGKLDELLEMQAEFNNDYEPGDEITVMVGAL